MIEGVGLGALVETLTAASFTPKDLLALAHYKTEIDSRYS